MFRFFFELTCNALPGQTKQLKQPKGLFRSVSRQEKTAGRVHSSLVFAYSGQFLRRRLTVSRPEAIPRSKTRFIIEYNSERCDMLRVQAAVSNRSCRRQQTERDTVIIGSASINMSLIFHSIN